MIAPVRYGVKLKQFLITTFSCTTFVDNFNHIFYYKYFVNNYYQQILCIAFVDKFC